MELQFKARLEKSQVESLIKAEINEHIKTINIQQLVNKSIDTIVSNRLESKIEDRLNGGSFLENVLKYVQRRLSKEVVLSEIIRTLDIKALQTQISKDIADKLIKDYE